MRSTTSVPSSIISGVVVGDSNLQDRGVAHYLLSLLFSLVSLLSSFCLCVLYDKPKKLLLPFVFVFLCLLMLSLPWVWNHLNMVGWTLFTWIVFDLSVVGLKTQPSWLSENNWMT